MGGKQQTFLKKFKGRVSAPRVFTLRLSDEVFDKIGVLATKEHRSITNYIEYVLLKHLEEVEREQGEIDLDDPEGD